MNGRMTIVAGGYRAAIAAALATQFRGTFREEPEEKPVTFKNQKELDDLIADRVAREAVKLEKKLGVKPEDVEDLQRLRALEADLKKKEEEAKGNYAGALKAQEESFGKEREKFENDRKSLSGKIRELAVDNAVVTAAAGLKAHNPKEVARLLSDRVTLDEAYNVVVLQDDGKTPAFVQGKPMSVAQLVAEYAQKNKHHFAPASGDAAGAKGGAHESDGEEGDVEELTKLRAQLKKIEDQPTKSTTDLTTIMRLNRQIKELEKKKK